MKAFPYSNDADKEYNWINHGMDLRDYFAAKAMQAMLSNDVYHFDSIPNIAYLVAENMMEARKENK